MSSTLLVAFVIAAAIVDVRQHRVPNVLVFSGVGIAFLLAYVPGGAPVGHVVAGLAVGIAMGLPLYWLRAMGAGDVKLMGMAGAFLGGGEAFVASLVIFIMGGALGLFTVWRRRAFVQLVANLKQMAQGGAAAMVRTDIDGSSVSVGVMPYGIAIATGTILYVALARGGIFQ